MKVKTTDAVKILKHRAARDPKLQELYEEEKINFQAAIAIREAREAAGLTQVQLAKLIGTTQSVISRLEDADYEGHTLKMLAYQGHKRQHALSADSAEDSLLMLIK